MEECTWSASTADVLQLGLPFFMTDSRKSRPPALATASAVCGLPSTAALMAAAAADATFVEDPCMHTSALESDSYGTEMLALKA